MVVVSAIDIFFDMTNPDRPTFAADLHVSADYGQIYIYSDAAVIEDDEDNLFLDALDDAVDSKRFVGTAGGLIDLMTPGQWNVARLLKQAGYRLQAVFKTKEGASHPDRDAQFEHINGLAQSDYPE